MPETQDMPMRFEVIIRGGCSFFYDDMPSRLATLRSTAVFDHQLERVVAGGPWLPDDANVEPHVLYKQVLANASNISDSVRARLRRPDPIDWNEWQSTSANSYEREHLIPRLTDEALATYLEKHILPNCQRVRMPASYDEALPGYLELLLKRFKRLQNGGKADAATAVTDSEQTL